MANEDNARPLARRLATELCHVLLQREPSPRDHAVLVNRLLGGCSVVQAVGQIIRSDEYLALNKPAADFIRDLHCTVLRRDINKGDSMEPWLEFERTHGRDATFEAFVAASEAKLSPCTRKFLEVGA